MPPKTMLVFKANPDGTDRFQGSRLLNKIALKSSRAVRIRFFAKVYHDNRVYMFSVQTARQGPIVGHHFVRHKCSEIVACRAASLFS